MSIWFAVLWISTSVSAVRADLVVFGTDPSKSTELSDMVNKNADVRNAIAAFERGDVQECERLLGQALKDAKDLPSIDVMIARLLMAKGKFNEALSRLETHLMKGLKDAEAHATMGEIALMSGRFTDAWLQFREALSIVTTSSTLSKVRKDAIVTQLLRLRAETAERRQDFDTAQILYKELEKAMPESGFPLMAQARILISNADITRGAELLRRAKKLDDSVPQPELQIALALASGKDTVETEKWFRDGIKQVSTATISNWFEYLKWMLMQDRASDVHLLIQRAPSKFQSDRLLRFLDAMSMRYVGSLDEAEKAVSLDKAEKAFSALLSENAGDMESADQLALILVDSLDQGKKLRAQQLSQNNLRRAPNEESAIATAAWVEFSLGATDVADQYFNSLISRGTRNPQTIYYVAKVIESRGRNEEAMSLYQTAVDLPGLFVQRSEVQNRLAKKSNDGAKKMDEKAKDEKAKNQATKSGVNEDSKSKETSIPKLTDPTGKSSEPSKASSKDATKQSEKNEPAKKSSTPASSEKAKQPK